MRNAGWRMVFLNSPFLLRIAEETIPLSNIGYFLDPSKHFP
jgi:hypothetical protein